MSIVYDYPTLLSEQILPSKKIEICNGCINKAGAIGSYFVDNIPLVDILERFWLSLLIASCVRPVNTQNRFTKWKRDDFRALRSQEDSEMFRGILNRR